MWHPPNATSSGRWHIQGVLDGGNDDPRLIKRALILGAGKDKADGRQLVLRRRYDAGWMGYLIDDWLKARRIIKGPTMAITRPLRAAARELWEAKRMDESSPVVERELTEPAAEAPLVESGLTAPAVADAPEIVSIDDVAALLGDINLNAEYDDDAATEAEMAEILAALDRLFETYTEPEHPAVAPIEVAGPSADDPAPMASPAKSRRPPQPPPACADLTDVDIDRALNGTYGDTVAGIA